MKKLLLIMFLPILAMAKTTSDGYFKDGKMFLYASNENNVIECTMQQLCDISLLKGDLFQSFIFTDASVWRDSALAKTSYFDNSSVQHVVLQATDTNPKMQVILVGSTNQYHFQLSSVKKSKTNKYVFILEDKIGNEPVLTDG